MLPYQQRVVDEKTELDEKREKLFAFLNIELFCSLDQSEKDLLLSQYEAMGIYSDILRQRISAFV